MIKHIIFDLDGVLIDARDIHYHALNKALQNVDINFVISKEEHLQIYDGLPTSKKLKLITEKKGLQSSLYDKIWQDKQIYTMDYILSSTTTDQRIIDILQLLKADGYTLSVASNSIRETVKAVLQKKGFFDYMDFFFSNEDVKKSKPSSEIFLKSMIEAGVDPIECLIVEDSNIGKQAARSSGAHLCSVLCTSDVTYEKIKNTINMINNTKQNTKWQGSDINILIPIAGAGTRF